MTFLWHLLDICPTSARYLPDIARRLSYIARHLSYVARHLHDIARHLPDICMASPWLYMGWRAGLACWAGVLGWRAGGCWHCGLLALCSAGTVGQLALWAASALGCWRLEMSDHFEHSSSTDQGGKLRRNSTFVGLGAMRHQCSMWR